MASDVLVGIVGGLVGTVIAAYATILSGYWGRVVRTQLEDVRERASFYIQNKVDSLIGLSSELHKSKQAYTTEMQLAKIGTVDEETYDQVMERFEEFDRAYNRARGFVEGDTIGRVEPYHKLLEEINEQFRLRKIYPSDRDHPGVIRADAVDLWDDEEWEKNIECVEKHYNKARQSVSDRLNEPIESFVEGTHPSPSQPDWNSHNADYFSASIIIAGLLIIAIDQIFTVINQVQYIIVLSIIALVIATNARHICQQFQKEEGWLNPLALAVATLSTLIILLGQILALVPNVDVISLMSVQELGLCLIAMWIILIGLNMFQFLAYSIMVPTSGLIAGIGFLLIGLGGLVWSPGHDVTVFGGVLGLAGILLWLILVGSILMDGNGESQ